MVGIFKKQLQSLLYIAGEKKITTKRYKNIPRIFELELKYIDKHKESFRKAEYNYEKLFNQLKSTYGVQEIVLPYVDKDTAL